MNNYFKERLNFEKKVSDTLLDWDPVAFLQAIKAEKSDGYDLSKAKKFLVECKKNFESLLTESCHLSD